MARRATPPSPRVAPRVPSREVALALATSEIGRAIREYRAVTTIVPLARGYDSADSGPGRMPRRASGGSASSQLSGSTHARMRIACQHLARSDLAARAILKMYQTLVVGDGAVVRSTTTNPGWNEMADRRFDRWCMNQLPGEPACCTGRWTFWQHCRMAARAFATDGDCLAIRLGKEAGAASGSIQMVEGERLQNPGNVKWNTPGFIDGVEVDKYLRPKKFHVSEWNRQGTAANLVTVPIEADTADLLVNVSDLSIGTVRGEPAMQAMLPRLERLNKYVENHGLAAYIQTLVAMFIESNNPDELQAAIEETVEQQPSAGPGEAKMTPGAIFTGRPGEKINTFNPTAPNINYKDYVWCELVMCAADMGTPASYAFFDVSESSYITERAKGAVSERRNWCPQEALSQWVRKVRAWKIAQWIREGKLPPSQEIDECEVKWPKAPIFDMVSEVQAWHEAVDANFVTHDEAVQTFGGHSAKAVFAARAVEVAAQKKAGITPPDKPGAVRPGVSGDSQAPPANERGKKASLPNTKQNPRGRATG